MKRLLSISFLMLSLLSMMGAEEVVITPVNGFPSETEKGYKLGVSACFAGVLGDNLIMAGGCNFPVQGIKGYYQVIYAAKLGTDSLAWRMVGILPNETAYGVTVSAGDSIICIGGCNRKGGLTDVYSIRLDESGEHILLNFLPSLPYTIDNAAGCVVGDEVFVVGGNQIDKASTYVLSLNLRHPDKWKVVGKIPGEPRVQPVCAAYNNKVYVWGGFYADADNSIVHTDGYSFNVKNHHWKSLPSPKNDSGEVVTLSGATAVSADGSIVCAGGVNKDIFLDAISGRYQLVEKDDYQKQSIEWYKFNPCLLSFNAKKGKWNAPLATSPAIARAGAMLVYDSATKNFYLIGGEVKPTVRTNEIEKITLSQPSCH